MGGKFLQVAEMVFENAIIAKLGSDAFANVHVGDFSILIELRVVHWKVDRLLVIENRH